MKVYEKVSRSNDKRLCTSCGKEQLECVWEGRRAPFEGSYQTFNEVEMVACR